MEQGARHTALPASTVIRQLLALMLLVIATGLDLAAICRFLKLLPLLLSA